MDAGYVTIRMAARSEIIVKKSRFIGQLLPARDFDEAQTLLEGIRRQHWDARHNCSAMIFGPRGERSRCSDDGEPQGTAGVPMLEALRHSGLTDVLAVVTRYFGGVLLGTGGLARAYTQAVTQAIAAARQVRVQPVSVMRASLPFALWGRAQAQLLAAGHAVAQVNYAQDVAVRLHVLPGREDELQALLAELSAGAVRAELIGREEVDIAL